MITLRGECYYLHSVGGKIEVYRWRDLLPCTQLAITELDMKSKAGDCQAFCSPHPTPDPDLPLVPTSQIHQTTCNVLSCLVHLYMVSS